MNWWTKFVDFCTPRVDPEFPDMVSDSKIPSDQRYEYRTVRYPKDQKKSLTDIRIAKELAGGNWYGYMPLQDADWRWTAEYRVDKDSPWLELGVYGHDWEAEYECNQHAKKRAVPKIKYLGKLP